ncbi:uncharacterized protein [Epargyreus clarus]|uniref:uncharacterized protein n=1 Tax=Epargyreus clarus TaxID=520877 RepID=UPI003C2C3C50
MYFFSIIVLCCLIVHAFSRPSRILDDYKEAKEDSDGDSYLEGFEHNGQKSSLKQFPGDARNTKEDLQDESDSNSNEDGRLHPDKDYLENNNDISDQDHGENARLFHDNMMATGNDFRRTAEYNKGNNNMLFQNNEKLEKDHESQDDDDETDAQGEQAEYFKQYSTMRSVDRGEEMTGVKRFNNEYEAMNRDRRQVKESETEESIGTEEISTQINEISTDEDEETAIKKHMKNLSKEELDELLNSLPEDKKTLLKTIIDSSPQEYDNINKREITKKAGANDENSFVGSEQSDAIKIQGGSANIEGESSMSPNTENSENTKKSDSGSTEVPMSSKTTEIVSSSEKSSDKDSIMDGIEDTKLVKSDTKDNLELTAGEDKIEANTGTDQGTSKNQKKREMNSKSFVQSESKNEESEILSPLNSEDLYCSENEDLSQLWNEESRLYNNNINKRACSNSEDSINSLEDSFPNGNDESNYKPGSDMVPLVRVKRTNSDKIVQKRDGNFISNLKVPFFSNAVENNEEDSDEGSEFQDDGFFDRRANFAKSSEFNRQDTDISTYDGENDSKSSVHNSQTIDSDNGNLESDTVSLGSDTDAVLSGIEGVDDNMMYTGVSRNKRTAEELNNSVNNESDHEKCKQRTAVSENEDNEVSEGINQLSPRYQENDAFGSLPRSYEEDLGRFKRIRRLKPLPTSENNEDSNKVT